MPKIDFNIGEIVYLKTDIHQYKFIITMIQIDFTGALYQLCCGTEKSWHYSIEISRDKDILLSMA